MTLAAALPQFAAAVTLLALTWLVLSYRARHGAGAGPGARCWWLLPLDLAPIVLGWLLLLAFTRRPVLSSILIAAAGAGVALADGAKRATLREPLVFADRAELLEVVRHPRLYIPFAGPLRVVGVLSTTGLLVAALAWLEPRAPAPSALLLMAVCAAGVLLPGWPPLLAVIARAYRRARPSGDPAADMRRFGFLACLIMHATLARIERPARRAGADASRAFGRPPGPGRPSAGPVVLLQIESFFDARRIGPAVPGDLLPAYDRLQREAAQSGLLEVPAWGANTVRTEFAALSGIDQAQLGLDRFNPYERFAQERVPTLVWAMKQAGYRTICVHPFDRGFYARDRVMPQLGFDEFRGPEAFEGAAKAGPYTADEAVAAEIIRLLAVAGPRVFVFGITMGNHGPWEEMTDPHRPVPGLDTIPDAVPDAPALRRYLAGLQASDRMIAMLMDGLVAAPCGRSGLLAVYGDHQPSLPRAFAALGFDDPRTDYAAWRPGARPGTPSGVSRDIRAEALPGLVLDLLTQEQPAAAVRGLPMDAGTPDLS